MLKQLRNAVNFAIQTLDVKYGHFNRTLEDVFLNIGEETGL